MKRKLKTLTEQFTDARTNYDRILGRSDKQLINEQSNPPGQMGLPITSKSCNASGGGGSSHRIIVDDNGTLRDPAVGDVFCAGANPNSNNWSYFQQYGCTSEITSLLNQCDGCDWANGAPYVPGPGGCGSKCHKTPRTYTLLSGGCADPSCCSGNCIDCTTTTPPGGTGCPGWSNYSNWESTFTSLPNFSSSNPNQPCQFLCQKDTQWSNQIQNVGPQWAAQLQCKLDKVQDLMNTHNCASSNAPAC